METDKQQNYPTAAVYHSSNFKSLESVFILAVTTNGRWSDDRSTVLENNWPEQLIGPVARVLSMFGIELYVKFSQFVHTRSQFKNCFIYLYFKYKFIQTVSLKRLLITCSSYIVYRLIRFFKFMDYHTYTEHIHTNRIQYLPI